MRDDTLVKLIPSCLTLPCGVCCKMEGRAKVTLKMRGSCDGKCMAFKCGTPNRGGRVVSGKPTAVNEYPWMVAFTYSGKLYCSGSLINDRYVLTAAHCVRNIKPSKVVLTLGSHIKNAVNETSRQVMRIGSTWFHPLFNKRTFDNDVALVKLNTPVTISKEVRPICLPDNRALTYEGEIGIVAGWGRMGEYANASNVLREVKVPIITNAECKTKKYKPHEITENMMCAGYDAGKIDACQGDSGGPLMHKTGARVDIVGLVSWGEGCARPKYPGVYTRLSRYWNLIEEELMKEESCYCPSP